MSLPEIRTRKRIPQLDGALIRERAIYVLLFLFPIGGVSIGSWFSGIFMLLVLIGLWDLFTRKSRRPLHREEKIWLWLCAGFFASYLLSGLANGWGYPQTRFLGVDIRYLLVVPLYLMLREYPSAMTYLLAGIALAAPVLGLQALYDVYILELSRAQGHYSPNLLGPFAVLVAVWLLSSWNIRPEWNWAIPLLFTSAMAAVVLSGSRGAWLGFIVLIILWVALSLRRGWRIAGFMVIVVLPLVAYLTIPQVSHRTDMAVKEITGYLEGDRDEHDRRIGSAVRLELWHAGWMVFKGAPILGVGRGNFPDAVQTHVDAGSVHPDVQRVVAHAHNAYVDVLASRGLVGGVIFLGMLFYPLFVFIGASREMSLAVLLGILHVAGMAVFSLTDASVFIKGNFVAIFLLCLSVFLSSHVAGNSPAAGRPARSS